MSGQILELYSERVARISKEKLDEGRKVGILEIITNMLKAGFPAESIASVSNYSTAEILELKQSITG